MKKGEVSFK